MSKQKLTAEEIVKVQNHMKTIMSQPNMDYFMAQTVGDVYDQEMPFPEILNSIARTARAGNRPEDNHVYYMTPDSIDKKVFILSGNCNVTQAQVTPNTRTELTFVEVVTNDYWICLGDFLKGDHDALNFYAKSIDEALNRYEVKNVLALLDAAAVAETQTFTLTSGQDGFDYNKAIDMKFALAGYGKNFVLISGANVSKDVALMDKVANTFREYNLTKANIAHIEIPFDWTVDTDASGQASVIDPDVAYLVAVSDSMDNRSILVARRDVSLAADLPGTENAGKDRIVMHTGNIKNVGSTVKLARGVIGYENFGAVIINTKTVAKFTRI